jgi:DNA-binding CsgD family transcriptional regulator
MTLRENRATFDTRTVAARLRDAHSFVEVAVAVCAAARDDGLDCEIALSCASGAPAITVECRRGVGAFACCLPILALNETIGTIRWSSTRELDEHVDGLATIGTHVAVRLAQLGHVSCTNELAELTSRQLETATLAARGYTNIEIAELLSVSENTIKKHLGDVFARLAISNRTELALRVSRTPTLGDVPEGVSYLDGCKITRYPAPRR